MKKQCWLDLASKFCEICKIYLCFHHILVNEYDEYIFNYKYKYVEKNFVYCRLEGFKRKTDLLFRPIPNCPNDHSIKFSLVERRKIYSNRSFLKYMNLFHLRQLRDACSISFYSGFHCNLVRATLKDFNQDFKNNLFFFRYRNTKTRNLFGKYKVLKASHKRMGPLQGRIFFRNLEDHESSRIQEEGSFETTSSQKNQRKLLLLLLFISTLTVILSTTIVVLTLMGCLNILQ